MRDLERRWYETFRHFVLVRTEKAVEAQTGMDHGACDSCVYGLYRQTGQQFRRRQFLADRPGREYHKQIRLRGGAEGTDLRGPAEHQRAGHG